MLQHGHALSEGPHNLFLNNLTLSFDQPPPKSVSATTIKILHPVFASALESRSDKYLPHQILHRNSNRKTSYSQTCIKRIDTLGTFASVRLIQGVR